MEQPAAVSTAIVRVTPISGCRQEWAPSCYLLEIDQARILLDCGTTNTFDMSHFAAAKKFINSLDLILLSHGDLQHCGGLSYLLAQMNTPCPVVATLPVHHMGLVSIYDAYQAQWQVSGKAPEIINLDELDTAFDSITILRYSQTFTVVSGNAMGIQVTPIAAGHTLGGAIWRIRKNAEEIFYATDFNHKREGHLDGAELEPVQRPSLLIADAKGALEVHVNRKQRDSELIETMMGSLKAGGTVLIPVDTAGRSLELLQTIENQWNSLHLSYPVLFLSYQSRRVLDLAKGMLEWMSESLVKVFEQDRSNPFELKFIRPCHTMDEIKAVHGPKVILATLESLDAGFARVLLPNLIASSSSLVLFTMKSGANSMAAKLLSLAKGAKINISWAEEVPLEGEELVKHQREVQEAIERKAAEAAFAQLQRQREEQEDDDEDDDEEDGDDEDGGGKGGNNKNMEISKDHGDNKRMTSRTHKSSAARRIEQEQIASAAALQHIYWTDYKHDWSIDNSDETGLIEKIANSPFYPMMAPDTLTKVDGTPNRHQCFPFKESRKLFDDYGEAINFNEFNGLCKEATVPSTPPLLDEGASEPKSLQIIAPQPNTDTSAKDKHPKKWLVKSIDTILKCTCKFIDFSGISDGRSLKTIFSRIAPRRLVLIGGSVEATEYLSNHFSMQATSAMEVYSPHLSETITICSDVNVIPAILSESLIAQLSVYQLADYEISWIRGIITREKQSIIDDEQVMMETDKDQTTSLQSRMLTISSIDVNHNNNNVPSADAIASPLLLGDYRLGEIRRQIINELRLSAVFVSGDLICGDGDEKICIRKDPLSPTSLVIEGPICSNYFSIRQILYYSTVFLQ